MRDDDDDQCVAECNYVIRRESRLGPDGKPVIEEVETCTGCGRVISRIVVPDVGA